MLLYFEAAEGAAQSCSAACVQELTGPWIPMSRSRTGKQHCLRVASLPMMSLVFCALSEDVFTEAQPYF